MQDFPDVMKEGCSYNDALIQSLIYCNDTRKEPLLIEIRKTLLKDYADVIASVGYDALLNWVKDSVSSQEDAYKANEWLSSSTNALKIKSLNLFFLKKSFIFVSTMLDIIKKADWDGIFYYSDIDLNCLIKTAYKTPEWSSKSILIEEPIEALLVYCMYNLEVLQKLINSKCYDVDQPIAGGRQTILTLAVINEKNDIVRLLILSGCCNLDYLSEGGRTALSMTIIEENYEIAKALIKAGANITLADNSGKTALDYALGAENPDLYIIGYLSAHGSKGNIDFQNKKGDSCLIYAAFNNHSEIVSALIKLNCNLNLQNTSCGDTALILATWRGNHDIANQLIDAGADVNIVNKEGKSALDYAVEKNNFVIINKLLAHGDHINKLDDKNNLFDWRDRIKYGNISKKLIEAKVYNLNLKDKTGNTALTSAIQYCDIEIVRDLIDSKQSNLSFSNTYGDTPLSLSLGKNEDTITRMLITAGEDINKKDENGQTLWDKIRNAEYQDFEKLNRLLVYGAIANIDLENHRDYSVLMSAAQYNHSEIVSKLIKLNCNLNLQNTSDGDTALVLATWKNNHDVAQQLIEAGADVNIVNKENKTALYYAKTHVDIVMIELLIKHGARDHLLGSDETCLIWAMQNNHDNLASKIIDSKYCNLDLRVKDDDTALTLAAENEYEVIAIKLIKSQRCDLNLQTKLGDTALTNAAENNHITIAHTLIESKDGDLNLQTKAGETALTLATIDNYKEIAQELIQSKRCDLNFKNLSGKTALMIAASSNFQEIAESLIMADAQLDIVDKDGKSALDYAIAHKNFYIINLLLVHKVKVQNAKEFLGFLNSCDKQNLTMQQCLNSFQEQQNSSTDKKLVPDAKIGNQGLFSPKSKEDQPNQNTISKLTP